MTRLPAHFLARIDIEQWLIRATPLLIAASTATVTAALSGIHRLWEAHGFSPAHALANGMDYRAGGSKGKPIPFGDIVSTMSAIGYNLLQGGSAP